MSYPEGLNDKQRDIMSRAMKSPIYKKGDRIGIFELLEDSCAHGCPFVKNTQTGTIMAKTMHGHLSIYEKMCKEANISPEPFDDTEEPINYHIELD